MYPSLVKIGPLTSGNASSSTSDKTLSSSEIFFWPVKNISRRILTRNKSSHLNYNSPLFQLDANPNVLVRIELMCHGPKDCNLHNDLLLIVHMTSLSSTSDIAQVELAVEMANGNTWRLFYGTLAFNSSEQSTPSKLMASLNREYLRNQLVVEDTLKLQVEVFYGANMRHFCRGPCINEALIDKLEALNDEKKEFLDRLNKYQKAAKELLDTGKYSNVTVVVQGTSFALHKWILAEKSPVFKSYFKKWYLKKSRFGFTDLNAKAFEKALLYIYCDVMPDVSGEEVLELFQVAHKFQLEPIKRLCVVSLSVNLTVESVGQILLLADNHEEEELKAKCIEFIVDNLHAFRETAGWQLVQDANRSQLLAKVIENV